MSSDLWLRRTFWQTQINPPLTDALKHSERIDVAVVGAGIAGLSVAYQMLRAGLTVAVFEKGLLGQGETGRTSAHLSDVLDEGFQELIRLHGVENARLAIASHRAAIDEIEFLQTMERISCDFRRLPGYLFLDPSHDIDFLWGELSAAQQLGLNEAEMIRGTDYRDQDLLFRGPYLRFPRQAQFHPILYIQGLAYAVRNSGGRIYTQTEIQEIEGGTPARLLTTSGAEIVASNVVVTTGVPVNDRFTLQTKMAPYRSYVLALRAPRDPEEALYWDTADPYHYVRFAQDPESRSRLLLIGGEDHRTGQEPEGNPYERLQEWAADRLGLTSAPLWQWSGQILEPHDGLAYIGHNPGDHENVLVVTGDSGHGLTHGTLAGLILRDLVLGQESPWLKLYDPSRINLRSLDAFVRENVSSTAPYTAWVSPGEVESVDEIPVGEGAVLRRGLHLIAACREESGQLHAYSAVCPHLNGIVHWNRLEKTWDCPCHGSRFDRWGRVMNGPAKTGLAEIPLSWEAEPQLSPFGPTPTLGKPSTAET